MNSKILFIEDDLPQAPEDNELWMLLLENGYAVAPARTGAEAWQLLGKEKFDVVIADIMLSAGKGNADANANLEGSSRLDMGAHLIENIRNATLRADRDRMRCPHSGCFRRSGQRALGENRKGTW